MRWVQHAAIRPHHCAVIPFLGNSNAKAGFFDTGQAMRDANDQVYISIEAVEQMARAIGWGPADLALPAKVESKDRRIAELEAEVAELNKEFDAIDVLASRGFQARKKAGRKVAA